MAGKLHMLVSYLRHRLTAKHGGHGIHSPFAYALCENVFYAGETFYDFERLQSLREKLLADTREIETGGFGAGSRRFTAQRRRISDIARHSISSRRQSEVLYKLANYLGIRTCIELGTALGVNTLYLALQNPAGKVYSVDGSGELIGFARALAEDQGIKNAEFIHDTFDHALSKLLAEVAEPVMVYIDGDHSYEATMRYFRTLLPLARGNNVFVFDDIYWSAGMTKAWREICSHGTVRLSIDGFYGGYVFFRPEIREKISCRLSL